MPIVDAFNDEGEKVQRYDLILRCYDEPRDLEKLNEDLRNMRKATIAEREENLTLQKEASSNKDYPLAKIYSHLSKDLMKMERAITFHINYYGIPDKGSESNDLGRYRVWPLELVEELDYVGRHIYLNHC